MHLGLLVHGFGNRQGVMNCFGFTFDLHTLHTSHEPHQTLHCRPARAHNITRFGHFYERL